MASRAEAQDSLDDADVAGQADGRDDKAGDADAKRQVLLPGLIVWNGREAVSLPHAGYHLLSAFQSRRPKPRERVVRDPV